MADDGDWRFAFESMPANFPPDPSPFAGLPDDRCQCPHLGYVICGSFRVDYPDGREEIVRAGEAYNLEPGHFVQTIEPVELVEFSPRAEHDGRWPPSPRTSGSPPRRPEDPTGCQAVLSSVSASSRASASSPSPRRPADTRLTVSAASSSIVAASSASPGGVDDRVDVAVPAQRRQQLVHPPAEQVQHAARDVGDAGDLAEVQRAQRPAARHDRDDGVARGQRRARSRAPGRAGRARRAPARPRRRSARGPRSTGTARRPG